MHFHPRFTEQGWRSGGCTRFPPVQPGFKSRRGCPICVEFVFSCLFCPERCCARYLEKCFKGAKRDGEKCPKRTIFHSNLLCSSQSVFKGSRTLGEFLADHFQGLKVNRTSLQLQLE